MANGSAAGQAIVDLAAQHIGEVHVLAEFVPKNDAAWNGPWDCSEFCSWLLYQVPRILFTFERYNGFGPRRRFGRATAYLWSFSNHFVRGKYVGDDQWDPEAPSGQVGASVLLRALIDSKAIVQPGA